MKRISLILVCLLCLSSAAFSNNRHVHSATGNASDFKAAGVKASWMDGCEIQIINQSYADVRIFGIFDDGSSLEPFNIYSFEAPHYISLYYYGYCHEGMEIDIETFYGYPVFSGFVRRGTPLYITPYYGSRLKAQVRKS